MALWLEMKIGFVGWAEENVSRNNKNTSIRFGYFFLTSFSMNLSSFSIASKLLIIIYLNYLMEINSDLRAKEEELIRVNKNLELQREHLKQQYVHSKINFMFSKRSRPRILRRSIPLLWRKSFRSQLRVPRFRREKITWWMRLWRIFNRSSLVNNKWVRRILNQINQI